MKKLLLTLFLSMTILAGCATMEGTSSNELLVTYSTMKVIEESEDITSSDVLDTVEKARVVLNADAAVSLNNFKTEVAEQIGFYDLAPSDRLLITTIVNQVEVRLENEYEVDVLSDEIVYEIEVFLDLVEQAARMSGE